MKNFSLLCFAFILVHSVYAQNPQWIVYNTSNSGLPHNDINCITSGTDGNTWIGTHGGGLAKFNGIDGTVYNTSNSELPHNLIYSMITDQNNNLWIGTYNGLASFNEVVWLVFNTSNSGLPNNTIRSITIDQNGIKWMGTDFYGLTEFDDTNWMVSSPSWLQNSMSVSVVAADQNGNKWTGSTNWAWMGNGLIKFDDTDWTAYNSSNSGLPDDYVLSIAIDHNDHLWIGTLSGGIAKFNGINWTVYDEINSGLPNNQVYSIAIDQYDNKWIGTDSGLAKFDGTEWTIYDTTNSELHDNFVFRIVIDGNNNKWIGTLSGLAVFNENGVFFSVEDEHSLSNNTFNIHIFPNPAGDYVYIEKLNEFTIKAIEIIDIHGSLVKCFQFNDKTIQKIDIRDLTVGVYFLRFQTENFSLMKKLIKH